MANERVDRYVKQKGTLRKRATWPRVKIAATTGKIEGKNKSFSKAKLVK